MFFFRFGDGCAGRIGRSVLKNPAWMDTDLSVLKADVSTLKPDVSDLKSDVAVLKADVSKMD